MYLGIHSHSNSVPGNGRGPGDGCPCPWVTEPKGPKMVGAASPNQKKWALKNRIRPVIFPLIHWNKNRNSKFLNTRSTRFIIKFHVNEVYEPVGENGRFHLRWRCRFVGATSLVKKRPFFTTWECFFFSVIDLITVWAVEFSEYTQLWRNDTGVWFIPWFIRNLEWWTGYGFSGHPQVALRQSSGEIDRTLPTLPERSNYDILKQIPQKQFIETRDSSWVCLGINLWLVLN